MHSLTKYLTSYLKRNWELEDYPIEIRHSDVPADLETADVAEALGLRPIPWVVRIPDWIRMTGTGETREEAFADLRKRFQEYKDEGNELPRPGTKVPIQFAPMVEVSKYHHIAEDFFPRIVGMSYEGVLITDMSSLWDFPVDPEDAGAKVLEEYGVDMSEVENGNLVDLFRKIEQK